ncbi:SemiSWEET transporter [Flavobacteriaceae bacterium]|nr:SemiSWEET transporter [Flavobacteriaceae bacterium]
MIDSVEIIGLTAAILTTVAFIPQVIKVISTNSSKGLSLTTFIIFIIGLVLWFIYGFFKSSISMILGNGVTFFLALIIIVYIIKNKKTNL